MHRKSLLAGLLALTLAACSSVQQPQNVEGTGVTMLEQAANKELRAEVGGTLLKIAETADTVGGNKPTVSTELQYFGLAEGGRIRLRILSSDPETNESWRRRLSQEGYTPSASGAVDFEQDPAEAFTLGGFTINFIEAQASWLRYSIASVP